MKSFFKKLENPFLVESTKTENVLLPYKTTISEANVKTNKMVVQHGPDLSQRMEFARNYFIFLKNLFQFKNFFYRVNLM